MGLRHGVAENAFIDGFPPEPRGIILADPGSSPRLLSGLPPDTGHRRGALAAFILLLAGFLTTLPFAHIALAPIPAFVPTQQALLLGNDLITAAVLFGQYFIGR